jgi:hypothetical protein
MNDPMKAPPALRHATLQQLAAAKALSEIRAVPMDEGWGLLVRYGEAQGLLQAQRARQPRLFRRLDTLVDYLREIGIACLEVEVGAAPPSAAISRRRPDRAAALRALHRSRDASPARSRLPVALVEAMAQADDPGTEWISHKDIKREWAVLRAALASREALT